MSKSIGHIAKMSLNITQPQKFDIPEMNFHELSLFVGKNGTGKTLILKLNWCFSMIANYFAISKIAKMNFDYAKEFQFIMDKSFDDQNFDGKIEAFFENMTVIAEFKEGKVMLVDASFDDGTMPNSVPIFMSKDTRLFDNFVKYMKMKKALGITANIHGFNDEIYAKLSGIYKLYDIMFMEQMIEGLDNYILSEDLKKKLADDFEIKAVLDKIVIDYDECEIYTINTVTEEKTKITRLSSGEQAIINMLLANIVLRKR